MNLELIAKNAKTASYKLASLSEEIKNRALQEVSKSIEKTTVKIGIKIFFNSFIRSLLVLF